MEKILVDTDVIIDFLRGHRERIKTVFVDVEDKKIKAYISPISIIELYAGENSQRREKTTALAKLLAFFEIVPLDLPISKLAGSFKREYKLGLADAAIAASCLKNSLKLFTFNIKHFKKISNLNIYSI